MEERWVCRRCYAANGEADDACGRCGLARGAVPPPEEQELALRIGGELYAPERPLWQRLMRFWWVPAIGIFLVIGYFGYARRGGDGAITGAGTLSIANLAVGDCFDVNSEDEISQVDASPCSEPHQYELFHIATWRGTDAFPSEEATDTFLLSECGPAFAAYTTAGNETLDVIVFTPTEQGWGDGDRIFQCAVYDTTEAQLTGSLRSE